MIRPPKMEDLQACYELALEMYAPFMREHGIEVVEADLMNTVKQFIILNSGFVVEHDGVVCGMCAWIVMGHPANNQCKIWQEVLWCLKSKYKTDALLLIRAMEDKAKQVGADIMVVANLSLSNEPALRRIYNKRGFNYMETHYARRNT